MTTAVESAGTDTATHRVTRRDNAWVVLCGRTLSKYEYKRSRTRLMNIGTASFVRVCASVIPYAHTTEMLFGCSLLCFIFNHYVLSQNGL